MLAQMPKPTTHSNRAILALPALVGLLLLAVLASSSLAAPLRIPGGTPSAGCPLVWQVVNSPNPGGSPTLRSVSAVGPADIWAVGYTSHGSTSSDTLAEHWDGAAWTVVPT